MAADTVLKAVLASSRIDECTARRPRRADSIVLTGSGDERKHFPAAAESVAECQNRMAMGTRQILERTVLDPVLYSSTRIL